MPKKICMIGTQFIGVPANSGGAIEFLSFNIAKGLSDKGFDVTYFSVNPLIKYDSGVLVERFPSKKTNALFFSLFILFKAFFRKFDVVYVSGCSMIFAGLVLSKLKKVPLIYHEFNHNPWIKPKDWLYDFFAGFSVKVSDKIIVSSSLIKKAIINQTGIHESKIFKIPNFINLSEFPVKAGKKEKKVLFVGRMVKHKGIDFLLELIQEGFFRGWAFEFITPFNGTKEEKAFLDKINFLSDSMKGKILLKKNLSRKQLITEFSSSSVLVLPSSQESFGLVLIEAMACFTPCVAFSVGGTTEIIGSNLDGFLVELNDKKTFKDKLTELMDNEEKRIFFGLNARKKTEEKFSFVNAIKGYELFFNEILVEKK